MIANDHPPFSAKIDIWISIASASVLFLPFCMFYHSLERKGEREEEKKEKRCVVPGGLSIINKASDEALLSSEDDSDREMLLIRLVSAKLTRSRMIGVEFPEIYDRRWRSRIARGEVSISKSHLDSAFCDAWARKNRVRCLSWLLMMIFFAFWVLIIFWFCEPELITFSVWKKIYWPLYV